MEKEGKQETIFTRKISRRQAIKAGGIASLGLAFSDPVIRTIRERPAFASAPGQLVGTAPPASKPCAANLISVSISGPAIVDSGVVNDPQYTATVQYDCGSCDQGPCDPQFTYEWMLSNLSSSTVPISIDNPGPKGSGSATDTVKVLFPAISENFTLSVQVTNLICGGALCSDADPGPVSDSLDITISTQLV